MNEQPECVSCSFCTEKYLPSEIGDHLMLCGNKTDQCPNCKKYIRRAIFAYHYENNCANIDEFETDIGTVAKRPQTSSTSQPNNPPSSPIRSSDRNDENTTIVKVNLPRTSQPQPTISQQSDSDFCESKQITTTCSFCKQQCDISDLIIHEEKCLKNPANIRKKQSSSTNGAASQNSDQLYPNIQLDDTATIPCELCQEPIQWRHFEEHSKACVKREQERMQNQPRSTDGTNKNSDIPCKHCNEVPSMMPLRIHEVMCSKHPLRVAFETRFKQAFQLPPLQGVYPSPDYPYSSF